MSYPPIERHAIIGNMRTAALVSLDGCIDWFCYPRFDAPSVFAAILDNRRGGRFRIAPVSNSTCQQYYWPDTNVLITHFSSATGAGEIVDFMPMTCPRRDIECPLVRLVKATRGSFAFGLDCRPAFNYGRDRHITEITSRGAVFRSPTVSLALATSIPLQEADRHVAAAFTLREGEMASFLIQGMPAGGGEATPLSEAEAERLLAQTVHYWQRWIARCTYTGRWQEMVHRSALALELLVYEPTGAVVAAPTTSLPENVGGQRNWDYRYSWMRDSAFTVYALLRVGLTDEADRFMKWLESRCREADPDGSLQTVYAIDGHRKLGEEALDHWEGYRGSGPVRIGNAAYRQVQMDIYGELMDAVYLYNKHVEPISSELWTDLRRLVDFVCSNWQRKDNGIWEVRGTPQHFVYSKVMCWVAVDRALRLAMKRSFPADLNRWFNTRNEIYQQVLNQGWNPDRQTFVQHYTSESLDASILRMPLVFFLSPTDPKMTRTLDALTPPLARGGLLSDGMIYRYNHNETDDGVGGAEGSFNMCSFWLVEALTRAGRSDPALLERACLIFERMLHQANHVGLYSEETGSCGEALGNFPQAFAHLALITAAVNLDQALREPRSARFSQLENIGLDE